jgi:hypothetical protein
MGKRTEWWKQYEPLYRGEGDGQTMLWIYGRELKDHAWEYVVVEVPDGDGPDYGRVVTTIRQGSATPSK